MEVRVGPMEVVMPRLGLTMKQGRVEKWLRGDGETVTKGEPLVEILSEKVTATVPCPADGVLNILVPAGQSVPVGAPLAVVARGPAGAPAAAPTPEAPGAATAPAPRAPGTTPAPAPRAPGTTAADASASGAGQWVRSTPAARRLARELGVDLAAVDGTGPDGLVTEQDVRAAHRATEAATPGQGETRVPLVGRRRVVAERMAASASQTAPVTLTVHADVTKAGELREALLPRVEASHGVRLTFTDIVVRVAAAALRAFPYMNASLDGETVVQHGGVHIGVAVDTDQGLVVPVIRDADRRGLGDIAATRHRLTEAARAGTISPDDLVGGTFTVTNLGMYEIEAFSPLINLPEAAILGVGAIEDRPVAQTGQVVVRPACTLSLVFDHRIVDGAPAARFLRWIKSALENPALLLL